jgi:transketolase
VKLSALGKAFPDRLIECGIAEENAATVAAALSKMGVLTFFADFGVFGVDETFSQHRMGDINHASVKLVCTHNGLDVGEDGKTHQCVDYVGNLLNLFGFKVLVPADANQTDAMVRYAATHEGNMAILMGRSKLPVITDGSGAPYYKAQYTYGKADWLRKGDRAAILTMGTMVPYALEAAEKLAAEGIEVGVMNISTLTQMDMSALREAAGTGLIVTYEDHSVHTGLGACVCSALLSEGIGAKVIRLGVTGYGISDTPEENYRAQGLDTDSLTAIVRKNLT